MIKLLVAGGLVGYLWQKGTLDFSALLLITAFPGIVVGVVVLNLVAYSMVAYRWVLLLHSQKIYLPFSWGHRVTYIGLFFNLVLPGGGMAGDALRLAYAIRSAPKHRPEALLSLFVDRAVGLYAMLSLCMLAIFVNPSLVMGVGPLRVMSVVVFVAVFGGPLFLFILFFLARRSAWLARIVADEHSGRVKRIFLRLVEIVRLYRNAMRQMVFALLLSMVAQGLILFSLVMVATTMAMGSLGAGDYVFATPWAWMANFIPLTPGGIGVGEAAFDQVCRWIETVPSGAAYGTIFLVFRLLSMMGTLPGLFAYLFFRQDVNAAIKGSPASV